VGGIPPSAIWPIFKAPSDEHTEIRTSCTLFGAQIC
jgi:hypothetical protein